MDVNRVRKTGSPSYGPHAVSNSRGRSAGTFQQNLGNQLKENYRSRVEALFDEISGEAGRMLEHADLSRFEHYRRLISELLGEIVNHMYRLQSEHVSDNSGRHRVYATVGVIDKKLEELCRDLIGQNMEHMNFLSRIDEIRGLVVDLLF